MVRKQLYLTAEQDRQIKRRARTLGVSEAELVRRAVDALITETSGASPIPPPLAELLAHTRQIAEGHKFNGPRPNRDELYDERISRYDHS